MDRFKAAAQWRYSRTFDFVSSSTVPPLGMSILLLTRYEYITPRGMGYIS